MTNDKGAEHEKVATTIAQTVIRDWEPESFGIPVNDGALDDFQNLGNHLTEMITKALSEAHEAGRREVIAEVVPVLENIRRAASGFEITPMGWREHILQDVHSMAKTLLEKLSKGVGSDRP